MITIIYYNRARYYNPELGRFISRDPIDISDDVNLYSYVGNSPVSFVNLMGTEKKAQAEQFRINFIKAYDEYLEIKEFIYNKGDKDIRFVFLNENLKSAMFKIYNEKKEIVKDLHYKRNEFNHTPPDNLNLAKNSNWKELSLYRSLYHQRSGTLLNPNSKFLSNDMKSEVIYNSSGNIVYDIEDIGTYNFFDPITEAKLHKKYDVDPYYEFGNGINDSTTQFSRLFGY